MHRTISGAVLLLVAVIAAHAIASVAEAQRPAQPGLATIQPPGPPPTGLRARFTAGSGVILEWTAAPGAQSYTVVRGFAGMQDRRTFQSTATNYHDVVGILPPNLTIDYQVYANYPDKSPGLASVSIRTPDTHPVTDLAARLEGNGRKVVVTWNNAAISPSSYAVDHLFLSAQGGSPGSQEVSSTSTTVTLTGLPPGAHTYAMLGYYSLPGVGTVESNPKTAPRITVRIPHCALSYWRVPAAHVVSHEIAAPPEVLLMSAGEEREFNADWAYATARATETERYGSHLRLARNDGTNTIELFLRSLVGFEISMLKPGENKKYMLDLRIVRCLP